LQITPGAQPQNNPHRVQELEQAAENIAGQAQNILGQIMPNPNPPQGGGNVQNAMNNAVNAINQIHNQAAPF